MNRFSTEEIWQRVIFNNKYTNSPHIEVSNHGRVKSITKQCGETYLKGVIINGYRVIRLRLYKERNNKDQNRIDSYREQIALLVRETGKLNRRNNKKKIKDESFYQYEEKIKELSDLLVGLKKKYNKELGIIERKRLLNSGKLVHRLVAEYFVEKPSKKHNIVGHLDFNKLNNYAYNLKWMTQEENSNHIKNSPFVIKAKKERFGKSMEGSKVCKLTSTKVMLIKKKLNQGVRMSTLAKTFKVSAMQISRIKRGENWAHIKAAD